MKASKGLQNFKVNHIFHENLQFKFYFGMTISFTGDANSKIRVLTNHTGHLFLLSINVFLPSKYLA